MSRNSRLPSSLAVAALLTTLVACSGEDDRGSATPDPATATSASDLPAGAAELAGRYAHFDAVSYEDDSMRTVIISTGLAYLEVRDGQLWNQMTFCHADTVTDQPIEVTIADAATQAIRPVATPVEVSGADGALRVVRPATPTPIGIELDDPANERLPTDPNDPRIIDADGDGNPGITSSIEVGDGLRGEIYLARREIFAYDLTQESPDRLVGTITDGSEQLVIGASDPIFAVPAQWEQIDDPEQNPVIWERVDDDLDCDGLAALRDELFPPNPAADW